MSQQNFSFLAALEVAEKFVVVATMSNSNASQGRKGQVKDRLDKDKSNKDWSNNNRSSKDRSSLCI